MNLFRLVHIENYQRRSFLSAVLYLWAELVRRLFGGAPSVSPQPFATIDLNARLLKRRT